jgi:sulfate permease, SulP family
VHAIATHLDSFNPYAFLLGSLCLVGLFFWPRLFKQGTLLPNSLLEGRTLRTAARMPGPIIALVSLSLLAALLNLPVETIGSRFGGIPQSLPSFQWPALSWASAQQLVIPSITIAMLGAVESLLCARVADNMAELKRHDPNQELMAQGVANIVAPFFGGIPATGTIARTVTNVRSGGTTPVAGIVHAVTLLVIVLVAAPLAAHVPLAVLAGILLFVAWNMGEWHEFARLRNFSLRYRSILLGTFFLTVVFDLTVAVEVGLLMACVFFIYRMGTLFQVEPDASAGTAAAAGVMVYRLYGSLFFGAVAKVEAVAEALPPGTRAVVLEMHRLVSMDTSGLDALAQLHRMLARQGVRLLLCDLNEQPLSVIRRAEFDAVLGTENLLADLPSALARAAAQANAAGATAAVADA